MVFCVIQNANLVTMVWVQFVGSTAIPGIRMMVRSVANPCMCMVETLRKLQTYNPSYLLLILISKESISGKAQN